MLLNTILRAGVSVSFCSVFREPVVLIGAESQLPPAIECLILLKQFGDQPGMADGGRGALLCSSLFCSKGPDRRPLLETQEAGLGDQPGGQWLMKGSLTGDFGPSVDESIAA